METVMKFPVDSLSDEALRVINTRHAWVTGTADSRGRVLGRPERVLAIPDSKVAITRDRIGLSGKTVVEFGCLEGAHTVALCLLAKRVVALEARDENIARTRVRCGLYGVVPEILKMDLETHLPPPADVFFHSGVLYHLQDSVGHLLNISPLTDAMLLDTHYADAAFEEYVCPKDKKTYKCLIYGENVRVCKSGMRPFSRWLGLADLVSTLKSRFKRVEVVDDRQERNGRRATMIAVGKIA
jgi:tRNA (mo5U34)-methyltransferase